MSAQQREINERAVAFLAWWAGEDAEGRVRTVVEDPSVVDWIDTVLAERSALVADLEQTRAALAALEPTAETRDYLTRTIATIRNHRDADNCWPQWANLLADEVERLWAASGGVR